MNNFYYFLQFYISTYLVQADRTNLFKHWDK